MRLQFNSEGFLALQNKLYQMDDKVLKIESDLLRHNFDTWIIKHFELNAKQRKYLESVDQHLKLILALDMSFAIENRLPISLNRAESIKCNCEGVASWPPQCKKTRHKDVARYARCGTLELNIGYEF